MSLKKIVLILVVLFITGFALLSLKWRSEGQFDKITVTGNYTITREEILDDFPELTEEDIQACFEYAARTQRRVQIA